MKFLSLPVMIGLLIIPMNAAAKELLAGVARVEITDLDAGKFNDPAYVKTFLPLLIQSKLSPEFPMYYSQGYLHDKLVGREDLKTLDSVNRENVQAYLENVEVMEHLTRLNVNLAFLQKHEQTNQAAGAKPLDAEVVGIRISDFQLVTFPGELTVEIGLNIKRLSPAPLTFVAGYTNGYIYYTPTEKQRRNIGYAQEDCDCLVAPEWQQVFEQKAMEIINALH